MRERWRIMPLMSLILMTFVAAFVLLTITPVYLGVNTIITEQTSKSYLDLVFNNHQQLTERLKQIEQTALSISKHQTLRQSLENVPEGEYESILASRQLNDWLNNFMYVNPYINSLEVYTDSEIPKVVDRIKPLSSIPWKEQLFRLDELDSAWLPSRVDNFSPRGQKYVLTYVMKVLSRSGEKLGYVEVNLDEELFWNLIRGNREEVTSSKRVSLLFDRKNQLVSKTSFGLPNETINHTERLADNFIENNGNFSLQKIDGISYLSLSTPISEWDWRLVEIIPVDEVYRNVQYLRNFILILGLILIFLTIPISTYISTKISNPLKRIVEHFKEIESGNFNERMDQHSIVEFHQLSQSYNKMVRQLQLLIDRLDEEYREKRDIEVKMLQSQINPHFLYNTLDMIHWKAAMQGAKEASQMATSLAKLFRISLSKTSSLIKLEEELEHAKIYIQIQQARFEDMFEYSVKIDPELKSCYVPRIILQPFIENSILHGFNKKINRIAKITITTELMNSENYLLTIEDNGSGLPEINSNKDNLPNEVTITGSGGYGLENVDQRLKLYFGSNYGVTLLKANPNGVRVHILLPIIKTWNENYTKSGVK